MKWTLYRYTIRELLVIFLLALVGFTFVLLTGRILQLAELFVNKGIGLNYILQLLYYLLPFFLVLTIPMATLLAVVLAFNRLSSDNEFTALKASGVSLFQMIPPVFFFALLAYLGTAYLSLYALPRANEASRSLLFLMASTKASAGMKERVFNDDFEGLVLFVERVVPQSSHWQKVFISDTRNPVQANTIIAREGWVLSDPEHLTVILRLKDGSIHRLGATPDIYQKMDFQNYDLRLDLRTGLKEKLSAEKHPADMSLGELSRAVQSLRARNMDVKFHRIKIHEKFSVPLACLIFGLLGVPLGIQSSGARGSKSMGITGSIAALLIYYLLTNAGISLAERGAVPIALGMWAPNVGFLLLGFYLLAKAANESPVLLLVWLNRGIERLRHLARERDPRSSRP